jgi:hypothetical protein
VRAFADLVPEAGGQVQGAQVSQGAAHGVADHVGGLDAVAAAVVSVAAVAAAVAALASFLLRPDKPAIRLQQRRERVRKGRRHRRAVPQV